MRFQVDGNTMEDGEGVLNQGFQLDGITKKQGERWLTHMRTRVDGDTTEDGEGLLMNMSLQVDGYQHCE